MDGGISNVRGVEGARTINDGTVPEYTDMLAADGGDNRFPPRF